jgi:hypothetical protein
MKSRWQKRDFFPCCTRKFLLLYFISLMANQSSGEEDDHPVLVDSGDPISATSEG